MNKDQLQRKKDAVKARILEGTAQGISGVGADFPEGRLFVFYTDHEKAVKTLQDLGEDFLDDVDLRSAKPYLKERSNRSTPGLVRSFLKKVYAILTGKFPVMPSSVIQPTGGGKEGYLGCFVNHTDGSISALTVQHIFLLREPHSVEALVFSPSTFLPAGESGAFGALHTGAKKETLADCALFSPDLKKVDLKGDTRMTDKIIIAADIPMTMKRMVTSLTSGLCGEVCDVDAVQQADLNVSKAGKIMKVNVTFDRQVLVKGQDFGIDGDSGTLVVMAQDEADKGHVLGLYMFTYAPGDLHLVTPLHACLDLLNKAGANVAGIHTPPP